MMNHETKRKILYAIGACYLLREETNDFSKFVFDFSNINKYRRWRRYDKAIDILTEKLEGTSGEGDLDWWAI